MAGYALRRKSDGKYSNGKYYIHFQDNIHIFCNIRALKAHVTLCGNRHDNPYKNLEDFEVVAVHYQTELVSSLEMCYDVQHQPTK